MPSMVPTIGHSGEGTTIVSKISECRGSGQEGRMKGTARIFTRMKVLCDTGTVDTHLSKPTELCNVKSEP